MSGSPVSSISANSHSVSDNPILEKLSQFMDQKAMAELIDTFIERSSYHIEKANTALQARDSVNLKMTLHTLKGSSANLGLESLSALCKETESQVQSAIELDSVADQLVRIATLYHQACDALRQYYNRKYL